jgi:hypothetical protein
MSYSAKKALCEFFWNNSYPMVTNWHQINEMDLVETLNKHYTFYQRQGNVLGIALSGVFWPFIYKKTVPKVCLIAIASYYGSEWMLKRHIDEFYEPLIDIFDKRYRK